MFMNFARLGVRECQFIFEKSPTLRVRGLLWVEQCPEGGMGKAASRPRPGWSTAPRQGPPSRCRSACPRRAGIYEREAVRAVKLAKIWISIYFCKFLAGSFSAVSKRNVARKYACDSIFKLYKICILLHRCNLKISAKNPFEKSSIFVKIQQ